MPVPSKLQITPVVIVIEVWRLGKIDQYPLLKVDKVEEIVAHTFYRFYGIVNPFNYAFVSRQVK